MDLIDRLKLIELLARQIKETAQGLRRNHAGCGSYDPDANRTELKREIRELRKQLLIMYREIENDY